MQRGLLYPTHGYRVYERAGLTAIELVMSANVDEPHCRCSHFLVEDRNIASYREATITDEFSMEHVVAEERMTVVFAENVFALKKAFPQGSWEAIKTPFEAARG